MADAPALTLPATRKRWLSGLATLLVLALAAFVQFSVVTRSTPAMPMVSDAADYFSYAYNLKHSGVYSNALTWASEPSPNGVPPDSLRPPGYPLFLLAIPGVDTSDAYLRRVGLVQAAMGVASVWLVFLIASQLLRPGWSHLAAAITAISPHIANMSSYLLTESLFLFLLLASIYSSLRFLHERSKGAAIVTGVLWGLCCLVRPTALFLPPLFALMTWVLPALRAYRATAVLILAAFLAVQAPWFIRNQVTPLDKQISLMVGTLHHGSYPGFMYENRPETHGWPFKYDPTSEQVESSLGNVLADIAGKFRQQPLTYANWYLVGKPGTFLSWGFVQGTDVYVFETPRSPYREDPVFAGMRSIALALHWPLMLLAVCAALLILWRPRWLRLEGEALIAARVLSAVVLYAIAFHMIVAPYPRYAVPFRPLLYILSLSIVALPFLGRTTTPVTAANA